MDFTEENTKENPRNKANFLSSLFFGYMVPLFKKGYTKQLDIDDLYKPLATDQSEYLGNRLETKWHHQLDECKKVLKKPSYIKALISTFYPEVLFLAVLGAIFAFGLELTQPIVLGKLLQYFRLDSILSKDDALNYAFYLFLVNISITLLSNQIILRSYQCGMQIRIATCALIYRKALRLTRTAMGNTSPGQIVNLLSNDVSRIDIMMIYFHYIWLGPLQSLVIIYFLYQIAGIAGPLGVLPIVLVTSIQTYTGKLIAKYRKQTALRTDERVRLMNEIISGVQVIKMYAWEIPFSKLIKVARAKELKVIRKSGYLKSIFLIFNLFTTRVALFSTLLVMALTDQPITASKVFVLVTYFNILARVICSLFIRCVQEIAEFLIAAKRIEKFLLADEFELNTILNENPITDKNERLHLHRVSSKWNKTQKEDTLKDISLSVKDGELVVIVGQVGSGKSSILETILGELLITSGSRQVNGSISYASQEPWLFSGSIRQNILFGQKFNLERYKKVVQVCCLKKDFEQFADGDLTMVADRGTSLSGGQKARINLARAVYREADIYLLDDPLSAVDIHVSKYLYDQCINGFLKKKAKILVTHQVHRLTNVENIIVLDEGTVSKTGSYAELAEFLRKKNYSRSYSKSISKDGTESSERKISTRAESMTSIASKLSVTESLLEGESEDEEQEEVMEEKHKVKEIQEESSKGKVKGSMFLKYFLSGGNILIFVIVASLFLLTQLFASSVDYFVSYWIKIEEVRSSGISNDTWSKETCLNIYVGLLVALFLAASTRSISFCNLTVRSSHKLHSTLFHRVVNTDMRFFDTNPSGRILNRFSKDVGAIDEYLPKSILDASQLLLNAAGSLILVILTNYYFIGFTLVVGLLFWLVRKIFIKTSKNIKRVEGILRSPAFTHLTASLQGLTTIRAFGAQETLALEFDKHQDNHTSAYSIYFTASAAYGFYMDLICMIFATAITFSFLIFSDYFPTSAGEVGLAITQALGITVIIQWGMKGSAEITNQLVSVERILEYNLLPEEKQPKKAIEPPHTWPQSGQIQFKNMGLKYYEEMPLVLRDFNIVVNPKEKVGIVGRTGAGKTSLISALFRLAIVEGNIIIDDINTDSITLQKLRSRISIIPQDPVLFSGTLRYNLDPFEEYDDYVLQKALKEVKLNDTANVINQLDHMVMDQGSNYSIGQRQLICLARAIIRNNKILMLDEATANVDPQTDGLIQETIRKKFLNCTVLTVAHRLNTIMDSDKIMVVDQGMPVEYDHPYILLQNKESIFAKMVDQAGDSEKKHWLKIASDNYKQKYPS